MTECSNSIFNRHDWKFIEQVKEAYDRQLDIKYMSYKFICAKCGKVKIIR